MAMVHEYGTTWCSVPCDVWFGEKEYGAMQCVTLCVQASVLAYTVTILTSS